MPTLTSSDRDTALRAMPEWRFDPGRDAIVRSFKFKDFTAAWAFMGRVAAIAERMDHHPDWSNSYDKVEIALTSHDAGGVTRRDTDMAAAIDGALAEAG